MRACSATPGFFAAKQLTAAASSSPPLTLIDGSECACNPTELAYHEASLLWPSRPISVICSLGTGTRTPATSTHEHQPQQPTSGAYALTARYLTNADGTHRRMRDWLAAIDTHVRYVRVDVAGLGDVPVDARLPEQIQKLEADTLKVHSIVCVYVRVHMRVRVCTQGRVYVRVRWTWCRACRCALTGATTKTRSRHVEGKISFVSCVCI